MIFQSCFKEIIDFSINLPKREPDQKLEGMNQTFQKVDPRIDLIESIMACNGKSRKFVIFQFISENVMNSRRVR